MGGDGEIKYTWCFNGSSPSFICSTSCSREVISSGILPFLKARISSGNFLLFVSSLAHSMKSSFLLCSTRTLSPFSKTRSAWRWAYGSFRTSFHHTDKGVKNWTHTCGTTCVMHVTRMKTTKRNAVPITSATAVAPMSVKIYYDWPSLYVYNKRKSIDFDIYRYSRFSTPFIWM